MAKGENQRIKFLYLLDILNTYTDDEHALSMAEIVPKLAACGVNAERKALYTDIEELRNYGADIIGEKDGSSYTYRIGNGKFEFVNLKTAKGKQDKGSVTVELSTFNNRITDATFRLDFMQMEAVTDVLKPISLLAFFVDEDGNKISFDVPIIAKEMSTNSKDRLMTEKFTLKSGKYIRGKDYYLVLVMMDDEEKEYKRFKIEIDIA